MPWTAADATKHTKDADTPEKKKAWAKAANAALDQYDGDEGKAVATANATVKKMKDKREDEDVDAASEEHAAEHPEREESRMTPQEFIASFKWRDLDDHADAQKIKERVTEIFNRAQQQAQGRELDPTDIMRRDMMLTARENTFDADSREAEAIISTGARVRRKDFWSGDEWDEVLAMSPNAIRLARFNNGAQLLDGHGWFGGYSNVMGSVVPGSARVEDGKLLARVKFSRNEKGESVARNLMDGHPVLLSAGYKTHKEEVDQTTNPVTRMATDWEPYEVSVVTVPAEAEARIRSFYGRHPSNQETSMATENTRGADDGQQEQQNRERQERERQDRERQQREATQRVGEIVAICERAGLDLSFAKPALTSDMPVDKFRDQVLEELAKRAKERDGVQKGANGGEGEQESAFDMSQVRFDPRTGKPLWPDIQFGKDRSKIGRLEAMAEALVTQVLAARRIPGITSENQKFWCDAMGRVDEVSRAFRVYDGKEQPRHERAKTYLGRGWVEMAAELIEYRGNITSPMQGEGILARAWHSTSDFPYLFENVMNKALLARYQLAVPTYREIAAERQFRDFRPHPQYRAGDFPQLQGITETGEIRYGTTSDSKESVSISPYGIIFAVSRQVLVNDDMASIDQITGDAGDMVLRFENTTFYAMLLSGASSVGPTLLQDNTPVFAAGHGNLAGTGAAISIDALNLARAALRGMKTLGGAYINVPPSILLVGPAYETLAEQLTTTINPTLTTSVNPFSGRLRVIVDANIPGNAWYVLTEPGRLPNFVYGFLNGATGPRTRVDEPFGVQGVRTSVEHDFGVGAIDYRGAYRNPGA